MSTTLCTLDYQIKLKSNSLDKLLLNGIQANANMCYTGAQCLFFFPFHTFSLYLSHLEITKNEN